MRIPAELWIKAYLRAVSHAGAFGAILRHGDDDAGAIFIKVRTPDGAAALYAPAPTGLSGTSPQGGRAFSATMQPGTPEALVDARIRREIEFDRDIWVVEVEDRAARHFLDEWLIRDTR